MNHYIAKSPDGWDSTLAQSILEETNVDWIPSMRGESRFLSDYMSNTS